MDLRRLRLFLAVVDGGGMTRAAESEHVSQPSVSQAIRELEADLGTALFHRVGRRVVLTTAGEALVEPARQVLRDVETGRAAVEAVAGLGAGLVDLVASGECELGITAEPVTAPGLASHELGRQDLLAVLPPGAQAAHTMAVGTMARYPLVTAPPGTTTRRQLEEAFADAHVSPRVAVVTAQREAILPLVLAGAGATLFPRPLAEQAAALGAVVVSLRPGLTRPVHLFHRNGPLSPAAAAFRDLALA